MLYLSNAFSLNMIPPYKIYDSGPIELSIREHTKEEVIKYLEKGFTSVVGHLDTARILSIELDTAIEFKRETVTLSLDDNMIVAQYSGPRLPEGTVTLPEGSSFRYFSVCYQCQA